MRFSSGDLHILENQPTRPAAPRPEELVEVLDLDARTVLLDENQTDPLMGLPLGIRVAIDDKEVRPVGGNDETLLTPDDKMIALEFRPGRGAEEIGAAPGFGKGFG